MDKEQLQKSLVEAGVPEDKVADMVAALEETNAEMTRQHDAGVNESIQIAPGVYLAHLLQNEPDWKKRAQLAAAQLSRNLGID